MTQQMPQEVASLLAAGTVIPAHPLALTANRSFDERRQRALTRYYMAAGAGGCAVAVHTTQFEIREPNIGLYEPVLALAADEFNAAATRQEARPFIRVAGVAGDTTQAVAEAEIAQGLGYHAVLLSPPRPHANDPLANDPGKLEEYMLDRARAVGEVLPVIGFYLQSAIRGPLLTLSFLRRLAEIESVVAIKAAPFNRYRTLDVVRAVAESGRSDLTLYTGNDDAIISDLISEFRYLVNGAEVTRHIQGGLLGQWSVWTRRAVEMLDQVKQARAGDLVALADLVAKASALTDANAALFDPSNNFAGCIAGVHEVLRRQGLLEGIWCLNPNETLSPGQSEEIDRVLDTHTWLNDDEFIEEHLDEWLR